MKPVAQSIGLVFVILISSSCTSYLTVARNEAINKEVLSQLKLKKKYKFELASGQKLRIMLDSVSNDRIYGRLFKSGELSVSAKNPQFSDSFENLKANTTKISRRLFNPFLTSLLIGFPILVHYSEPISFGFAGTP
jgi:hypothetical protein